MIQGAYYRSLLIYYLTPLLGAEVISVREIENYEISLIRK